MQATTVAARGLAEDKYTVANFHLSLSDKGATVPAAKDKLKKQIESLNTTLASLRTKLDFKFIDNSVRSSSQMQEDYEYDRKNNENKFIGHIATYNYSFQIDNLDVVNALYDALTSLNKVTVGSPSFGLKPAQRERLNKKALKNAFAKAKDRFEAECKVLNLVASEFEIANWEVTYGDSQRSNRVAGGLRAHAMSARVASNSMALVSASPMGGGGDGDGDADGSLDLVAGLAEVVVNLEVGYARKVSQVSVSTVS